MNEEYIKFTEFEDKKLLFIGDDHNLEEKIDFNKILKKYDMKNDVLLLSETTQEKIGNLGELYDIIKNNKKNRAVLVDIRVSEQRLNNLQKFSEGVHLLNMQRNIMKKWNEGRYEYCKKLILDSLDKIKAGMKGAKVFFGDNDRDFTDFKNSNLEIIKSFRNNDKLDLSLYLGINW